MTDVDCTIPSAKTSFLCSDDNITGKRKVGEKNPNRNEELTANDNLLARPPKRKKRKRARVRSFDSERPLAGVTISVSTLSDNTKSSTETTSNSYNDVCKLCRELGADVIELVCKRVNVLVCSEAAVRQATQRVRKAIKRNKPLVSVTWLEQCRKLGRKVDFEEYRLDKKAKDAIQNRMDRLRTEENNFDEDNFEAIPDSGWSEPKDLGCCCVCHENGTTADCPWCVNCPLNV